MAVVATGVSNPAELEHALREHGASLQVPGLELREVERVLTLGGWTPCEPSPEHVAYAIGGIDHRRTRALASPRPDPMPAGSYQRVRVDIVTGDLFDLTTRLHLSELTECDGETVH